MLKEDKNFIFDSLQNDLNNGPPASTGEDQETGVVRWFSFFLPKTAIVQIGIFKVQVQLNIRGLSTAGGLRKACIHRGRQPAGKFTNKVNDSFLKTFMVR